MSGLYDVNPATVVFARGELASLRVARRPVCISCLAGEVWVTASRCREDWILAAGSEVTLTGCGKIVVQALRRATVRVNVQERHQAERRTTLPIRRRLASLQT